MCGNGAVCQASECGMYLLLMLCNVSTRYGLTAPAVGGCLGCAATSQRGATSRKSVATAEEPAVEAGAALDVKLQGFAAETSIDDVLCETHKLEVMTPVWVMTLTTVAPTFVG
jgi:hypothetical protein